MPRRDADLLLEDIRSAIGRIERYTSGMTRDQFLADEKTIDSIVRNLEIAKLCAGCRRSSRLSTPRLFGYRFRLYGIALFTTTSALIWKLSGTCCGSRSLIQTA